MPLPAYQLCEHAGLLLDLAAAMREGGKHGPLARRDVREQLQHIEAMGDPLGLAARLRELAEAQATVEA